MQGKEELEADLTQSGLTLLFTSHDRRFIERVATRFWWIHQGQLLEIHDLSRYDEAFSASAGAAFSQPSSGPSFAETGRVDVADDHPDRLLERMLELEQLLADDRARKPKFQKPQRQVQWQAELDQLMRQLDH